MRKRDLAPFFALLLGATLFAGTRATAQAPRPLSFLAVHYEVSASLDPTIQGLSAKAKVEFQATEPSRLVQVELHPNLKIASVTGADGKAVLFERDLANPLIVQVTLPQAVVAGSRVTLTFAYAGPLANDENSPVKGVTLAVVNAASAYLLLPARWFPLTAYPSNRYTAVFNIEVPSNFAAVGTCKASAPVPGAGGKLLYTFRCDKPVAAGTFVAGNLQIHPEQVEGISIPVYAPPSAAGTADYAADVARAVTTFSDAFGPPPDPSLTLAQMPNGSVRDFAAPGLLLVSERAWDPKSGERALSRLVAAQWWGSEVMPASAADVWISDGLARYSEALYAEQTAGKEAGARAVDDFAVGALMYEDAAPIAQAQQLQPFTSDYRSVVMNKGAMVYHMLRAQLGDKVFSSLLRDFYSKYEGKSARVGDFERLVQERTAAAGPPVAPGASGSSLTSTSTGAAPAPPAPAADFNSRAFFGQWLNSTGVPEFKIEYVVLRTPKGFRIVGKIKQDLDIFRMPLQVKVDTEGNPEIKTLEVIGTNSEFSIDTFGRPKPGGIRIDPNNNILKNSPQLRTRAAIARGEELAEQGRYYDAIQQYQRALDISRNSALAHFRMGEAFFYQKNYMAAANSFREAIEDVPEPGERWTEVWAHIYLGKIFDVNGSRERAVNEYSKAKQTNDDTGGAQAEVDRLLAKPYSETGTAAGAVKPTEPAPKSEEPVKLKKRDQDPKKP